MDLTYLSPLYTAPGPYITAYLDGSDPRDTWPRLALELRSAGADPALIETVRETVETLPSVPEATHAVFAANGRVLRTATLPGPPPHAGASLAPLPDTMPLVVRHFVQNPYARALLSEPGLDPAPLATTVAMEATSKGVETTVVIGTPDDRRRFIDSLPRRLRDEAIEFDLDDAMQHWTRDAALTVGHAVEEAARRRLDHHVAEFRHAAAADTAAVGYAATAAALRAGRAASVFLDADAAETTCDWQAWIGPRANQLAEDAVVLERDGISRPEPASAGAALIRAVVAERCGLVVVDPGLLELADGVGATVR